MAIVVSTWIVFYQSFETTIPAKVHYTSCIWQSLAYTKQGFTLITDWSSMSCQIDIFSPCWKRIDVVAHLNAEIRMNIRTFVPKAIWPALIRRNNRTKVISVFFVTYQACTNRFKFISFKEIYNGANRSIITLGCW